MIKLNDGKYTYINDEKGQRVLRYGEPWRNLTGDNFVLAMAQKIESLEEDVENYRGQSRNPDDIETIRQLEHRVQNLTGLVMRMVDRWWCFVQRSLPSNAAKSLHQEAINVITENKSLLDKRDLQQQLNVITELRKFNVGKHRKYGSNWLKGNVIASLSDKEKELLRALEND